jgi:hypothetical protein
MRYTFIYERATLTSAVLGEQDNRLRPLYIPISDWFAMGKPEKIVMELTGYDAFLGKRVDAEN